MGSLNKIRLSYRTVGIYTVKNSIAKAMEGSSFHFKGKILDVGCGNMPYREFLLQQPGVTSYIGMDIEYPFARLRPNLLWDGISIPLQDESVDTVILTEVLEHCPYPEIVLKEIFRVLRTGGCLFLTVPFLWMLHEVPHDEYRYTPFSLKRHLGAAGFSEIELRKLGGWNSSMAQMLSLWIAYKKRPKLVGIFLKILFLPVVYFLYKFDRIDDRFENESMITGLSAIVLKR